MREKTHRPQDVDRYIKFLQDISAYSIDKTTSNDISLKDIIKRCGVSNSAEFALKKLNVIKKETDFKWTYEWGTPTASHAKQILDFNLEWRKQKQKQPTIDFGAEFQTVIEKLQTISSNLIELLKTPENSQKQSDRFYIAGQITTAGYKVLFEQENWSDFENTNDYIIKCTDDLITKLYKK
jgi:hypothetical protein